MTRLKLSYIRVGQARRSRLLLFHATVPCNQYNLFPCGRMGLDSLSRPLVEEYASLYTKLARQGKLIVLADSSPRSLYVSKQNLKKGGWSS